MFRKTLPVVLLLAAIVLASACTTLPPTPTPEANLPNPASVFCEENGGKLELRQDASGGVAGVCVFSDGSECDEWAFFRGECKPGAAQPVTPAAQTGLPNPASVFCEENGGKLELRQDASGGVAGVCVFSDGSECDEWAFFRGECKPAAPAPTPVSTPLSPGTDWQTHRTETPGYTFQYPPGTTIIADDNPLKSISVIGPGGDWPSITISHPASREEYRPPPGVDLDAWLVDHYLMPQPGAKQPPEVRQPDAEIAGERAIHLRFDRSPQSYAYDRYYFAHEGQLYMIVIGHPGDKEDWEVYDRFLGSFRFTE